MAWDSHYDIFKYTSIKKFASIAVPTKRAILSRISLLFDPLGLLGPVVLLAKALMQELWRSGISWDDPISEGFVAKWLQYEAELQDFRQIHIPRKVFSNECRNLQLHGFCDASETGYGASLYIRSELIDGSYSTQLWCSKSRVAPLKSISIAKLELCAALLLARIVHKCIPYINHVVDDVYLWSDSKIVLCWLRSCSRTWNAFVANRVGEIQSLTAVKIGITLKERKILQIFYLEWQCPVY